MSILYVSRKFPPSVGGMEVFAHDLYEALSVKENVILIKYGGPRLLSVIAMLFLWLRAIYVLIRHDIDVIHVGDGMQAPLGGLVAKIFKKKWLVVIHGLDFTWPKFYYQMVVPPAVKRADKVICISQEVLNQVIAGGVKKEKAIFIPLAIKDDIYNQMSRSEARAYLKIEPTRPLLLSVGRLVKRKGIVWFIENVLNDLIKDFPDILLLIIGDGNDKEIIRSQIKQYKLENNVWLLGRVSDKVKSASYLASDIFIMPNISVPGDMEGFGLVLLEAALVKLPIVASNIEGIKDAISDGDNGVLLESENAAEFKERITRFLKDKQLSAQFGEQARRYTLDNYQWDKVADKYIKVYKELAIK